MTPRVSVLIDTYNYGRFIEEAIGSVLSQDFPPGEMEILVIDDGSTDDTAERIQKYGDRIQYFQKPNGGQASAFNLGVARARGDFVAFLDADDYWLPGKLRRVVDEFERHPEAGLAYHRLFERKNQDEELTESRFEWAEVSGFLPGDLGALLRYRPQPTSAITLRRAILERLYPIPEAIRLQADGYVGLVAPLVAPVLAVGEFLAVYRVHGQNLYASEHTEPARDRIEQRIAIQRIIGREVKEWIVGNGHDPAKPPLRVLLEQWQLYIDGQRLALSPPSRTDLLRFELRKTRCWSRQFGPRLRAINYFNVLGAFLTGNKCFDVDAWRLKVAAKAKRFVKAQR